MLIDEQLRQGARDVYNAEQERRAIPQLSRAFPHMELRDAYAIQRLWAEMHIGAGAKRSSIT